MGKTKITAGCFLAAAAGLVAASCVPPRYAYHASYNLGLPGERALGPLRELEARRSPGLDERHMFLHRNEGGFLMARSARVLLLASAFAAVSCANINPGHMGKFTFQGIVKDAAGKPVPNAWVKVRGWETLTDAAGKW
ncbi:MAG: carboxypeptidase regulatory-like domain-containing protein [Deltaproteobacteria bacterium]|nr:carboxypeptidase regulatory-like domain-containing protein [Deltaproteobacteria bacterium]